MTLKFASLMHPERRHLARKLVLDFTNVPPYSKLILSTLRFDRFEIDDNFLLGCATVQHIDFKHTALQDIGNASASEEEGLRSSLG